MHRGGGKSGGSFGGVLAVTEHEQCDVLATHENPQDTASTADARIRRKARGLKAINDRENSPACACVTADRIVVVMVA
jgi:hypothetical protein